MVKVNSQSLTFPKSEALFLVGFELLDHPLPVLSKDSHLFLSLLNDLSASLAEAHLVLHLEAGCVFLHVLPNFLIKLNRVIR